MAGEAVTIAGIVLMAMGLLSTLIRRPPEPFSPNIVALFGWGLLYCSGEYATSFLLTDRTFHWVGVLILYAGVMGMMCAWWISALRFAEWLGNPLPGSRGVLKLAPIVLYTALWLGLITNPWHGLFLDHFVAYKNEYNLLWFGHAALTYFLAFSTLAVFVFLSIRHRSPALRGVLRYLLLAGIAPIINSLLFVTGTWPFEFDATPTVFAIGCALLLFAINRSRILLLSPVPLEHLLDYSPDAEILVTDDFALIVANPTADTFFEKTYTLNDDMLAACYTQIESIRQPDMTIPDRDGFVGLINWAADSDESIVVKTRNDDWPWARITVKPLWSRQHSRIGYVLHIANDTANQRIRETMMEHEAILEQVAQSSEIGLLVADPDGTTLYSNERLWHLLGEPADTFWSSKRILEHLLTLLQEPENLQSTIESIRSDPEATLTDAAELTRGAWYEWSTRPLRTDTGIRGRIWLLADITEARKEQKEREEFQRQMEETQRLESLGLLAGGIAHDFNNVLTGILGYLDLARTRLDDQSDASRPIAKAYDSASRATHLAQQLLAYSGRGKFVIASGNVQDIVQETLDMLGSRVTNNATTTVHIENSLFVDGDQTQLRQVILNLVMNASEALREGPGTIAIRGYRQEVSEPLNVGAPTNHVLDPGAYAVLEVTDSGPGIKPGQLANIFEPFFTTKSAGHGLGLAAVLGIVTSHQGAIQVESEPGASTCFRLYMPLGVRPERRATKPAAEPLAPEVREDETVLIVEDDETIRALAHQVLTAHGYRAELAENGRVALDKFLASDSPYCLVFMDMTMPEMNGAELYSRLRAISSHIPILATSGYAEEEITEHLSNDEMFGFIQKPYNMQELIAAVHAILRQAEGTRAQVR